MNKQYILELLFTLGETNNQLVIVNMTLGYQLSIYQPAGS